MMKVGDTINGYKILQEFATAGGGLCRWTFVEKDGRTYFLKEFLQPTYPSEDSPGSPKVKADKRKRCEQFEQHHRQIRKAISSSVGVGGNLIFTLDFFRAGAKYYKITEKVDVSTLKPEGIAKLSLDHWVLILKTVAHSLSILHQRGIVHGDLKPDNILIKQKNDKGLYYIAKLIDFDNSYFARKPPEPDEVVGDMVYYSPELARYIKGDRSIKRDDLYTASDIFALGLIYCQYLTDKLPVFDAKYQYPCIAANNGKVLCIHSAETGLPEPLVELVNCMLCVKPNDRPTIKQVFDGLKTWDKPEGGKHPTVPPTPEGGETPTVPQTKTLKNR